VVNGILGAGSPQKLLTATSHKHEFLREILVKRLISREPEVVEVAVVEKIYTNVFK
jgi:hypothetical protein